MKSCIAILNGGHNMPSELKDKLLGTYKSQVAFMSAEAGVIETTIATTKDDLSASIDLIRDGFKNENMIVHLTDIGDEKLAAEDNQPFELIKTNDGLECAAILEGDFPQFEEEGHTNEAIFIRDYFKDEVAGWYKEQGEDIDKLMDFLGQDAQKKRIMPMLRPRGTLTILGGNGKYVCYTFNDKGKEFSFGMVSDPMDYVEIAAPAPKVTHPEGGTKMSRMEQLKAAKAKLDKEQDKPVTKPADKPATTVPDKEPVKEIMIQLPPEFIGKPAAAVKWINRNWGENYPRPTDLTVQFSLPAKDLLPSSGIRKHRTFTDALQQVDKEKLKTVSTATFVPPLVPTGQAKAIHALLQEKGNYLDAAQIQALEKKFDSFTQQLGIVDGLKTFLRMPQMAYRNLCVQQSQSAAVLMDQMRHEILRLKPDYLKDEAPAAKTEDKKKIAM